MVIFDGESGFAKVQDWKWNLHLKSNIDGEYVVITPGDDKTKEDMKDLSEDEDFSGEAVDGDGEAIGMVFNIYPPDTKFGRLQSAYGVMVQEVWEKTDLPVASGEVKPSPRWN